MKVNIDRLFLCMLQPWIRSYGFVLVFLVSVSCAAPPAQIKLSGGFSYSSLSSEVYHTINSGSTYRSRYCLTPYCGFSLKDSTCIPYYDYNASLSCITEYYCTGNESALHEAEKNATFIDSVLTEKNLLPECVVNDTGLVCRTTGTSLMYDAHQPLTISLACMLAEVDTHFVPLVDRLASGVLNNAIDSVTGLSYPILSTATGLPVRSEETGFEVQLGSCCSSVIQSLTLAYDVTKREDYLRAAQRMFFAIWERRNKSTNLISESWDIETDKPGTRLYPLSDYRFDDMGGAYLRAALTLYAITGDPEYKEVTEIYSDALLRYSWSDKINGGAFNYINRTDVTHPSELLETYHGLFIGTLLSVSEIVNDTLSERIREKCIRHSENVYINHFGVKNGMIPHCLDAKGNYFGEWNDSQLGYSVLQYAYGYSQLSNISGNPFHRSLTETITCNLIRNHQVGDNVQVPSGFVNIMETGPKIGYEDSYLSPEECVQFGFLPEYLLYNSIQVSTGVRVSWSHKGYPIVFGCNSALMLFDYNNLHFSSAKRELILTVTAQNDKQFVDLKRLGLGEISELTCDGVKVGARKHSRFIPQAGTHRYRIRFNGDV